MANNYLLSLCVPTYGVCEWVFPVLESIYIQNVDHNLFEVVVTDNGNNIEFQERIKEYQNKYSNFIYKKTDAKLFLNEIESYKLARGKFIKFVNHRTLMEPGSITYLLDFVKNNISEKPFVYFADGAIPKKMHPAQKSYDNFDSFVSDLGIWNSWSTGMAFWKEDFDELSKDIVYNELFPHTTILHSQRNKAKYIIDNELIMSEMKTDTTKKGTYDVYHAFAVEFPAIILDLHRNGDLSFSSFLKIKNDVKRFVHGLYYEYNFLHKPCSYSLDSYKKSMSVFYKETKIGLLLLCFAKSVYGCIRKFLSVFRR